MSEFDPIAVYHTLPLGPAVKLSASTPGVATSLIAGAVAGDCRSLAAVVAWAAAGAAASMTAPPVSTIAAVSRRDAVRRAVHRVFVDM